MSYSKYERELVDRLENDWGFAAMRAPSSGAATERDLPDVIAMRPHMVTGSDVWVFEVKYTSSTPIYVDIEEADALKRFADDAHAKAAYAFRFNGGKKPFYGDTDWYFKSPDSGDWKDKSIRFDYEDMDTPAEVTLEVDE